MTITVLNKFFSCGFSEELFKARNLNCITPFVLCGSGQNLSPKPIARAATHWAKVILNIKRNFK